MITLIGHGYIGTHIAKKLRNFEWISHNESPSKTTRFIINATGYIGTPNVDACEINKDLCMQANVLFPLELERKSSVPILHITSGCVYDGYPTDGWKETDAPNLTFDNGSFYSGCKGLLQTLLESRLKERSYLFRIRMPFCDTINMRNLLYKYERYATLVDTQNSMTCIEDLLNCIDLFQKELPEPGIYNIVNKMSATTNSITDMMGITQDKTWIELHEFNSTVKAKRSNCSLNTDKISALYDMPDVYTALDKTIHEYRKNTR